MDPIQIPEGQELAKRPAPLGRQPPSFTLAPIPSNITLTHLYQELKPIGLFDPLGNLVGLNFFNNTGYPSDVTTSSSICTGATIYKGQYQVALSHINRHQGSYYVLRTHDHQYFHSLRPTDWRLALMTLRFVGPAVLFSHLSSLPLSLPACNDQAQIWVKKSKMSFANAGEIFELSTSEPMALPAKSYEPAMGMPRIVSELQPWGVMNLGGALIGFHFMNYHGDDTNVMAASDISPNARVFQGGQPQLNPVLEAAKFDAYPSRAYFIALPVLTKSFILHLPEGYQKVPMQLKVVGKLQYDVSRYTPTNLADGRRQLPRYERAVILIPDNTQRFLRGELQRGLDKVKEITAKVILEEVPFKGLSVEPSNLKRMKLH
ncbi:hypothetical protein FPRO04_04867 [Fusarium proliferatum]|nr:hypothetical protein FPRO04_04867 [Fusarium proliferatum]